jgi:hypothetical protein
MIVKKNVLSKEESNLLLKETIFNDNFPWYYLHNSATLEEKNNTFNYSWYHALILDGKINSGFFELFKDPIFKILEKFNLEKKIINRIRLGKTVSIGKKYINNPHIDQQEKHQTILYYLNDSDGDTYFYKKDKKTIAKQITPEQNKAVLFNGLTYHASSKPIKNIYRLVLNINLIDA